MIICIRMKNFEKWLNLYGKAWVNKDHSLIAELFDDRASYQEKPFEKPYQGISEISEYWRQISQIQSEIKFDYEIITSDENYGVAHWHASFIRKNDDKKIELDGIFLVHLNSDNKCFRFMEWWQSKKHE